MKASELVTRLEKLIEANGDLDIHVLDQDGDDQPVAEVLYGPINGEEGSIGFSVVDQSELDMLTAEGDEPSEDEADAAKDEH